MNEKEEGYRIRDGKTILNSGQGWMLPDLLGQLRRGQDGEGFFAKSSVMPQQLCKVMGYPKARSLNY